MADLNSGDYGMGFLHLERVSKLYGEFAAVRDFDLEIEQGEFISLLGPSGCGKTTTLQMIAGLVAPTNGRIALDGILEIARPSLLRLSATLNDTVFLLVRSNFDAVCLDRVEGPFPIRSFTGDIGGRVPLGIGQGSIAILAFLPEPERDAIIQFNMPRILDRSQIDEVDLRIKIEEVRRLGAAHINFDMIAGMAGLGVPIIDNRGCAVAALSIGTLSDRLTDARRATMTELLKSEAAAISAKLNPFDPALRYPSQALSR